MSKTIIFLSLLVLLSLLCCRIESAHILIFHTIASYSHRVSTYPLADALAKRGHKVTYISPFYPKKYQYVNPNITEIVPASLAETIETFLDADFNINFRVQKLFPRIVFQFYETGLVACENVFTSPEIEKYFKENPKVDLIISDNCMAECSAALAYKHNAKHIFFNLVILLGNEYDFYGFAPESGAIPELEINPPQTPMTFFERVFNALISIHFRYEHYKFITALDAMARKYLDAPDMPFLDDVARNMSLVLYAADLITDYPRTTPPLVINIGGLLCTNNTSGEKLPKDLDDFINGDKESEGFVYISLGSLVVASNLPDSIKKVFFETMEAFPKLRFLWKWNGPFPEKYPKNLYLGTWFPQTLLLGHPKIKGFVTQGGRPSTTESLCNAVPMLSFPVLGDQDVNSNRMNRMGGNVVLELATVNHKELYDALYKVAVDGRMKERMLELRRILLDKPISALEEAVFWTEYALRYNDTSHLRGATFHQTWWQRRLLDVWAFLYTIVLVIIISVIMIIRLIWKFIRHTSVRQIKESSKKNK